MIGAEKRRLAEAAFASARPAPSGWFRANCPFCLLKLGVEDTRRTLSIHKSGRYFHCFRCEEHGSLPGVHLAGAGEFVTDDARPASEEAQRPPEGYMPMWAGPGATALSTERAWAYLRGRNVTDELVRQARIGVVLDGAYRDRVVVPILAPAGGGWRGWCARALSSKAVRKYLYPRGMSRKLFYQQAALAEETDVPVLVVEGVFDALAVWPHGVAVLGKPTDWQLGVLAMALRPVVLVLDGDAWEEGWAWSRWLRAEGARAGAVRLPPKTDPDEVDRGWLFAAARAALDEV